MRSYYIAFGILCLFLVVVFTIAFLNNRYYPAYIIAGESSAGTWASGALLVMSATISLVFGMRRGWFPWSVVAVFFLVLAVDERFMLHEALKTKIIFHYGLDPARQYLLAELPVMGGAVLGMVISFVLWRQFRRTGRTLLVGAILLGIASVTIDVFALGVLWEDSFKVVAELLVTGALLSEI
ncbi:MAG TPA: hypothetical protein VK508_21195 [Cyclobacteriaceae bacterium]|nr:hypothetical protein [Cyclobacteriaceae bacterium]